MVISQDRADRMDPRTTVGPDRPPKYPTTWYTDYMIQYQKRTYDLLADANRQAAE